MATNSIAHDPDLDQRTGTDRRERRPTVSFPERRLGFERREDGSTRPRRAARRRRVRRISESPRKAGFLMAMVVLLAIADMGFTFRALDRGLEELNPVMATLLDAGHGFAAFVKVGVTAVLAGMGWWFRRFRRVIEVALIVAGIMSLVVVYHLLGLLVA